MTYQIKWTDDIGGGDAKKIMWNLSRGVQPVNRVTEKVGRHNTGGLWIG